MGIISFKKMGYQSILRLEYFKSLANAITRPLERLEFLANYIMR